jgi:4-amino-4-deoxy-L-arabinose transferase-like glycosyltransferase
MNDRRIVIRHIISLFALALLARMAMLILHPFDGLYGQDAFAYYDYSIALRSALIDGQSLPAFFWPIGYPLHLVLAFSVLGIQPIAAQLISLIAGASIAPLTYLVARESLLDLDPVRAQRAGLVAGSMMIVAGQLMISSLSIMSDTVALMWATLSAWLLLRYIRRVRSSVLVWSACALSIAIVTRWSYALLIFPWSVGVLLFWQHNRSAIGFRRMVVLTSVIILISGSIVGGQLLSNGSNTFDLHVNGWTPINFLRSDIVNSDGSFHYALPMSVYYAEPAVHPAFLFPVLIPLWLIGLLAIAQRRSLAAWLLIGWPLSVYVFLAGNTWQNPRFSLELFPPLAIWVGVGFDRVWLDRSNWRRALIGLIVISWIGSAIWSVRVVGNFVAEKTIDLDRVQHLAAQLPTDATILTFSLTLTLQHYAAFEAIELFTETPATLIDRVCGREKVYAYLDVSSIEQQWHGLSPEVNYRWLRDGPGLEMIDQYQGYTLFKVQTCEALRETSQVLSQVLRAR